MFGERISVGNTTYILGAYLASGLIGTVFPAWEEKDSGKTIVKAVKVPAPNLTENLAEKFWQEFGILEELNANWKHPDTLSPFPSVEKGEKKDGTEVLVMEFIPDEMILSRVFNHIENPVERETKYLQAALSYAQMLGTLHQAGYTCPDRKTPDVRWKENENRLVVLDWNVVTQSLSEENIQHDFYLFGSMWHQFLTGKYASADLDVLDDEYWGDVTSIGTRHVLKKLLTGQYSNDGQVKVDFESLVDARNKGMVTLATKAREIYAEVKVSEQQMGKFLEDGKGTFLPSMLDNKDLDALFYMDLAWRMAGNEYKPDRDKFLDFVRERPHRLAYYAQVALLRGNYAEGLASANLLSEWMKTESAELQLSLGRWRVLIRAAASQPSTFRDAGLKLSDWLAKFEKEKLDDQPSVFWAQQEEKFPKECLQFSRILEIFPKELQLRKSWADFHQLNGAGGYADDQYYQSQQVLNKIQNFLDQIESLDREYAQSLKQAILSELPKYAKDIDKKVLAESGVTIPENIAHFAKESWAEYIRYRIQDSRKGDEWRKRLESVLRDLESLESILPKVDNNDASQIMGIIIKLLGQADIWHALGSDLEKNLFECLRQLAFPTGLDGILGRLNAAVYFAQRKGQIPDYLQTEIRKIQLLYVYDAFLGAEEIANQGDFKSTDYEKILYLYQSCNLMTQEG